MHLTPNERAQRDYQNAASVQAYEACGAPFEHPACFPSFPQGVRRHWDGFERAVWAVQGFEPPSEREGWEASYYQNDVCPSFTRGPFTLWVDHPRPEEREYLGDEASGARCALMHATEWNAQYGEWERDGAVVAWEGDDPLEGFAFAEACLSAMRLL